jgi:glycosyltransferase involved in cell wall biosynthesis
MKPMVMALKRLVRPLIPDRIMARYRLQQHSRQVRNNVDVLVATPGERRRWLRVTPDTYRIGWLGEHTAALTADGMPAPGTAVAAVVTAEVVRPRLVGRRRVEPTMRPTAVRATAAALAEVGDSTDPVVLHRRLADAGHRILLLPTESAAVDPYRRDPIERPVVLVLAAVPMHDVGGGSRGAQITIELLRRGFHVVYVALHGTYESVDLGLRFIHPHLEQYRPDELFPAVLAGRCRPGVVLLEIPAPVVGPLIGEMRRFGWRLVYDIVDLWSDPALGGEWYRPEVEHRFIAQSDLVLASAEDLVDHAAGRGVAALLVPNAVNAALFGGAPGPVPSDLPAGDGPLLGYHGSLYGDWFDWEAVADLGRHRPEARVVLIGDIPPRVPALPGNVHLLGLKPQTALLDYLARFDVGLLPFRITATTHAVSPLKVFEYLACGVPVAAPPLRSLEGIAGVHPAPTLADAVAAAQRAAPPDRAAALRRHSWEERVGRLLAALAIDEPAPGSAVRTVIRPAVHHFRPRRRL